MNTPITSVVCSIPVINLFSAYVNHQTDYEILFGFFQPYQLNTDFALCICIVCGIDTTHVVVKAGRLGRQFHADWGTETPEGLSSFIQEGNIHHITVLKHKQRRLFSYAMAQ